MVFARIDDNRQLLSENGIIAEILEMLRDAGSTEACEALIVMSSNIFCLYEILAENVYSILLSIAMSDTRDWSQRSVALTAFLKLINIQGMEKLIDACDEIGDEMAKILTAPVNLNFNLIATSIVMKLSSYQEIKEKLLRSNLPRAMFEALVASSRSTQLMVRLFNLLSNFIDQESVREEFNNFSGIELIEQNMKSTASQLRVAVCNFINAATSFPDFCELFIQHRIHKFLMENFDCIACSDAYEAIMKHDLSLKFGLKRRLGPEDKITSGFYAINGNWIDPENLREIIRSDHVSPREIVFTVNQHGHEINIEERSIPEDKELSDLVDCIRNDPNFWCSEMSEKILYIALAVSEKLQTTEVCSPGQFKNHVTDLKNLFQSSVVPLGSLLCGNSFEAAFMFKVIADQLEIDASLNLDDDGKGWNQVCDDSSVVDLIFDVGAMYQASSYEARKYLLKIP